MTSAPTLSVVIPCRNSAATLGDQLSALAAQSWTGSWEVIVADNGSRDGSVAIVSEFRRRFDVPLRLVDASARKGAAHARNIGAKAASGDQLAFVDADDVVGDGWVRAMATALQEHPFVASRFAFDRLNPQWLVEARGRPQSDGIQRLWYPPYSLHAGSCGLGVHRELHEAVGGFNEELPHLEDTDYCVRVQRVGMTLHFASDAVIHVRHRESTGDLFRQARLWAHYNTLIFARHRPTGTRVEGAWKGWAKRSRRLLRRARRDWRTPGQRASLIFQAGWQWGLLTGSLRHRVPPVVAGKDVTYVVPEDSKRQSSRPHAKPTSLTI